MKAKNNNQVEVDNTKDNLFLISIWISVVSIFGIFTLAFINSDAFQIGVPELSSVVSYLFSVVIPIFALLLVLTLLYLKYKKAKNNTLKDFKKKIILFTMLSVLPSCIMIGLLVGKSMAYTMAIIFFFYVGVAMIGTLLFHEEEYTEKDKYSIRKRLYNSLYAIFLTLFLIFLFYFFGTYVQHIDVSTFEFATVFIIIGIILLFWDWVEYECLWPDDKKPSYRIKAKLKETINNFHKYIKHFKFKHQSSFFIQSMFNNCNWLSK